MYVSDEIETVSALIVDDERLAVRGIEILLQEYSNIRVVGTAGCIEEAVRLVENKRPDLIFLDIQLQGETGLDLFDRVAVDAKVVFVTAYDEYAVRAFEVNALDYILKPVSRERFKKTINRVFQIAVESSGKKQHFNYNDVITLHSNKRMRFLRLDKIVTITSEGDYSSVSIAGDKEEFVHRSLKDWEQLLPSNFFIRVHRSTIVNIEYIEKVESATSNRFAVYLRQMREPIFVSQRYSSKLRKQGLNSLPPIIS